MGNQCPFDSGRRQLFSTNYLKITWCPMKSTTLAAILFGTNFLQITGCVGNTDREPTAREKLIGVASDLLDDAHDAVRPYLKFPQDAEFDWLPNVIENSRGDVIFNGTVKAKNELGTQLTHKYGVVFRSDHKTPESWSVVAVTLDDEVFFLDETE